MVAAPALVAHRPTHPSVFEGAVGASQPEAIPVRHRTGERPPSPNLGQVAAPRAAPLGGVSATTGPCRVHAPVHREPCQDGVVL